MSTDIFCKVSDWLCNGIPKTGLSSSERAEIIASARGSYLAEHVGRSEHQLTALDDESLVSVHHSAMVDASR